jgi:hypothetical protein
MCSCPAVATLVGGGILVQDAAGLLEAQLGVLGDEQVGTFDDVP